MSSYPNSDRPVSHASGEQPALPEHASPASTGLPNDASQHPGTAPAKSGSWLRVVILILVIAAAVAFVVYRIKSNNKATQQQASGAKALANKPVPVAYDVVQQRSIPIYLTALGTVTAYNTVTLKSRVDGQITRVNFREGQKVSEGQLLIEIDPRPYQAALAQAQGNLVRDQANAANAQVEAARYNQLYAAGVVSKEQTQAQESTAGQASGTLAADQAAIQAARVNLAYTRISSPISGIVGLRQVDIGNIIAANSSTGLVVITQVEPIAVIFTLPEDQLPQVFQRVRAGKKLVAEAWDRSNLNKLATGSLLTVDNQIDTTTGTAKLKAVFDNHDGALYPNQFVNIRLVLEDRTNAVTMPAAALQTGTNGSFVYVIDTAHPIAPDAADNTGAGAGGRKSRGATAGSADGTATGNGAAAGSGSAASASGTTEAASGSPDAAPAAGAGAGGRKHGGQGRGGAGGGGRQTSYPVIETPVQVDLTQGSTIVIRSGVHPGQQVVTDGEEKLTSKSKVIPHPAASVESQAVGNSAVAGGSQQGGGAPRTGQQTGTTFQNGSNSANAQGGGQSNQQGTTGGAPRQ